jgi:catechol 2,3-dioxygenase-like lactoylglutathione lyase family enzyme
VDFYEPRPWRGWREILKAIGPVDTHAASRRRRVLRFGALALVATATAGSAFAQGMCQNGYETKACPLPMRAATAPIAPIFASTGWRTVALDHLAIEAPDYRREAAFYVALMGWTLRSDNGSQAILDIGSWGTVTIKAAPLRQRAVVTGFSFVIAPWDSRTVEAELRKRGLSPVRDDDGRGFESFHVRDPDGWDLQIGNGRGLAEGRRVGAAAKPDTPAPFAPTGWKTVWLDHLSFRVSNYKESASFYANLVGWSPIYDEGSQIEMEMGDVGDIIVRGGNPFVSGPQPVGAARAAQLDHISFGIRPWDTDAVKAELDARKLTAAIDTSTAQEIHVASYRSYHTRTPNGFNLQISFVDRENRLAQSSAVRPRELASENQPTH